MSSRRSPGRLGAGRGSGRHLAERGQRKSFGAQADDSHQRRELGGDRGHAQVRAARLPALGRQLRGPEPARSRRNWAGRGWSIWQFTSSWSARGIDCNVDKNKLGVPLSRIKARDPAAEPEAGSGLRAPGSGLRVGWPYEREPDPARAPLHVSRAAIRALELKDLDYELVETGPARTTRRWRSSTARATRRCRDCWSARSRCTARGRSSNGSSSCSRTRRSTRPRLFARRIAGAMTSAVARPPPGLGGRCTSGPKPARRAARRRAARPGRDGSRDPLHPRRLEGPRDQLRGDRRGPGRTAGEDPPRRGADRRGRDRGRASYAADLQIASTLRVFLNIGDVSPLIEGGPAADLARRWFPAYEASMPAGAFPPPGSRRRPRE